MTKALIANLKFLNQKVYLIDAGFNKNQFVDTNHNVWQADEIEIIGWEYWNGVVTPYYF